MHATMKKQEEEEGKENESEICTAIMRSSEQFTRTSYHYINFSK
jgi:hypothetical protein